MVMKSFGIVWRCGVYSAALVLGGSGLRAQELKNIAASSQGGQIIFFASQYDDSTWLAKHLIDGSADAGWAGQNKGAQSIILAFQNKALAEIHDVLINPYTREDSSNWAKDVEIQISTTYPFRDFRSIGKYTLKPGL